MGRVLSVKVRRESVGQVVMLTAAAGAAAHAVTMLFRAASPQGSAPALLAALLLAAMGIAFGRGWSPAGALASVTLALLIGWYLPEPFVTGVVPAILVVPMLMALLVAPAWWSLLAGLCMMLVLVTRAGFVGVYMQPTTVLVMALINGAVVGGRMLLERSLAEAQALNRALEGRVLERTAALEAQHTRIERLMRDKKALYSTVSLDLKANVKIATNLAIRVAEAWKAGDEDAAYDHERRLLRLLGRLNASAQDLLDVSELSEGQAVVLEATPVCLPELVERVVDQMSVEASDFGIEVVVEPPPEQHWCWCDPRRTERVLWVMLGNALKAVKQRGQGGYIFIALHQEDSWLRCEVRDSGVGIEPEQLMALRHRFVRALLPGAAGDGIGVGLTLGAQLVSQMGGELNIDSYGRDLGAKVAFTLPLCVEQAEYSTEIELLAA